MPAKMVSVSAADGASASTKINPDYVRWHTHDQALLRYLLSSVTREVLMGITTASSSTEACSTLEEMYGSKTLRAPSTLSITLATSRKGTMTMADYYSKMKSYADDMAACGQPLSDEEFTTYVLTGLDEDFYNPLVSSIVTRVEPISLPELYSQMLSYELRVDKQFGGGYGSQISANATACGRVSSHPRRGGSGLGRGHGQSRGTGHGVPSSSHGSFNNNANYRRPTPTDQVGGQARPKCQVYLKLGHTASVCWYRFDEEFVPDTRVAVSHPKILNFGM
jgi:hypothetical protein